MPAGYTLPRHHRPGCRRPRGAFLLITANYSTTVPWLNFHTPTSLPQSPTTAEKGEHHRSGRQTVAGGTALHPAIPIRSENGTGSSSGKANKRSNDEAVFYLDGDNTSSVTYACRQTRLP